MMKNNRPDQDNKTIRTVITVVLAAALTLPLHGCNENVPVAVPFDAAPVSVTRAPVEELDKPTKEAVILGGRLYDDWPTVSGKASSLTVSNPMAVYVNSYPDLTTGSPATNTPYGDFIALTGANLPKQYRCKTCHGFTYLGSSFFPDAGIMDAANNKTVEEIQAIISDGIEIGATATTVHSFGGALSSAEISALATFIKYGVVDIGDYIRAFAPVGKGNASNGESLYIGAAAGCARSSCHGLAGKSIEFEPGEFVGTIGKNDPDEMLHKIRFGQPGNDKMPNIYASGLTTKDAADIMTYTQKLPAK